MNASELLELLKTHPNTKPAYVKAVTSGTYPAESIQLDAVNRNHQAIRHIINPSEAVQLAAVKKDPSSFLYIEDPDKSVQERMADLIISSLKTARHLDHPSPFRV